MSNILKYFSDEDYYKRCGLCDNCIKAKKNETPFDKQTRVKKIELS